MDPGLSFDNSSLIIVFQAINLLRLEVARLQEEQQKWESDRAQLREAEDDCDRLAKQLKERNERFSSTSIAITTTSPSLTSRLYRVCYSELHGVHNTNKAVYKRMQGSLKTTRKQLEGTSLFQSHPALQLKPWI